MWLSMFCFLIIQIAINGFLPFLFFVFFLWISVYCAQDKAITVECAGESIPFHFILNKLIFCCCYCIVFARCRWSRCFYYCYCKVICFHALRKCSNVPPAITSVVPNRHGKKWYVLCVWVWMYFAISSMRCVLFFAWD